MLTRSAGLDIIQYMQNRWGSRERGNNKKSFPWVIMLFQKNLHYLHLSIENKVNSGRVCP